MTNRLLHLTTIIALNACLCATGFLSAEEGGGPMNRLGRESSPYLLLHARNPVDWYPWGPEALERAKAENKPIFLSVGYSSCYWCHVMEREVFSNPAIAAFMNEHFINIKVDREERPDLDDIYMTSLLVYQQAAGIGGGGGWPLSLFLTPEGNPVAGGTYIPPADTPDGRTGFRTAAEQVRRLWAEDQDALESSASLIAAEVRRLSGPALVVEEAELNAKLLEDAVSDVRSHYDPVYGGVDFRSSQPNAPRFPSVPRLQLLLQSHLANPQPELLKILEHSLTAMAHGGIRDHLGGGFHRYSTDRRWHVPHFEKMLYDQAQLLEIYAQVARLTGKPLYREVAGEIADFVRREFVLPDGGFCSALDAETNAVEGAYYVWTEDELQRVLGPESATLFADVYGMRKPVSFEHGYVLHLPQPLEQTATAHGLSAEELSARLSPLKSQLLQTRNQRERPLLDDKVLTEWNAQMIQGLAESGRLPGREDDLAAAARAADFLLTSLRSADGSLLRSWRNGKGIHRAYLDDYAFLVSALLRLHESTGADRWLQAATEIAALQISLFYDRGQRAFFYTSHEHERLIARTSTAYDSTAPSGNSITIRNLLALARLSRQSRQSEAAPTGDVPSDRDEYLEIAETGLRRFASTLKNSPAACSGMALALQDWLRSEAGSGAGHTLSNPGSSRIASGRGRTGFSEVPTNQWILTGSPLPEGQNDAPQEPVPAVSADERQVVFRPILPDGDSSSSAEDETDQPVKAKVYPYFDKLERGGKCLLAVELRIHEDWHINANPAHPGFLVPTEIKITSRQKIRMTRVKYPEHQTLKVAAADEASHVYGGTVIVYAQIDIDAAETAETGEMDVRIRYQACNEDTCQKPSEILLRGKLPLANPGEEIRKINQAKFPRPKDSEPKPTDRQS